MSPLPLKLRQALLAVVLLGAIASLLVFILVEPSFQTIAFAIFLIVLWTPVKGLIFRRFGANKPYLAAMAANASSLLIGLPFHFDLSFWPHLGVSFLASGAIETLTVTGLGWVPSASRGAAMAFYASFAVHLLTAGFFASFRSLTVGVPILVAGFVLVHVPAFFSSWWDEDEEPSETQWKNP